MMKKTMRDGGFCEKVEDFCDHIGETAEDLTAKRSRKSSRRGRADRRNADRCCEGRERGFRQDQKKEVASGVFSRARKKDEKEETAAAKTDTAAPEAAAADEASEKPAE